MIRFSAAATNVLSSRATPAAVRVLPAGAVIVLTSAHSGRNQPSGASFFCPTCKSSSCGAVTSNICCSSSSSSTPTPTTSTSGCSRRPRTLVVAAAAAAASEPLRRNVALAASPSAPAPTDPLSSGAPAICDPSAYKSLSMLILLYECIRRAYGRPLLEAGDLLALPALLDSLPCCVLLLLLPPGSHPSPSLKTQPPAPSAATATATSQEAEPVGSNASIANGKGVSSCSPSSSRCCSVTEAGSDSSSSASTSTSSSTSSSRVEPGERELLPVQYMNRAAAEALKLEGGKGPGGSHTGVQLGGLDGDLLRTMLSARGSPQRGTTHSVRVALGTAPAASRLGGSGGGDGGGGSSSSAPTEALCCPEALLVPLMSPNGLCAGLAVLFERWDVRDAAGRVALEGRPLVSEVSPRSQPAGMEALQALRERVRAQADEVRGLKSQQGLTNKDPRVVAAVTTLQQLKTELELQQRLHRAFSGEDSVLRALRQTEQQSAAAAG